MQSQISFVADVELRSIRKSKLTRASLGRGQVLVRDIHNPKDENAIHAVQDREHVAYLEKDVAALLARHMDAGEIDLFG